LPETLEVTSPRRGLPHKYYCVCGEQVPNKTLYLEGDVDEKGRPNGAGEIRANNEYLVAPGTEITFKDLATKEEKTGMYVISKNVPIARVEYDDFMAAIKPYLGHNQSQTITPEEMANGVSAGMRHAKGIRYACHLIGKVKLDAETAFFEMRRWNQLNNPPMDEKDLKRQVRDACRYIASENNIPIEQVIGCGGIKNPIFTELDTDEKQAAPKELQQESLEPISLKDLKDTFKKWLFIGSDEDVIDVIFSAAIDRRIKGDPLWMALISPSGGTKTEIVRSLKNDDIYTLDSVTPHTFVSGRVDRDEDGNPVPVIGILKEIDKKVLIIKDFTVLLGKRREDRDEIFSQLRSLYDGYIEFAFGTSSTPVRIEASIGLIIACTPALDSFTKMYLQLGERFLKIRHHPDSKQATHKALENLGKEEQMRKDLINAANRFLKNLKTDELPSINEKCKLLIEDIALSVAILRTPVPINFWKFEINDAAQPVTEYPTRLVKQLMKLVYSLAIIRERKIVNKEDIETVKRVARDTCVPNRIAIIQNMLAPPNAQFTTSAISKAAKIPLATCWRELKEMEYLGLVEYEKREETATYGPAKHTPEKDGWTLLNTELKNILSTEPIDDLFTDVPPTCTNENNNVGIDRGDASEKEEWHFTRIPPSEPHLCDNPQCEGAGARAATYEQLLNDAQRNQVGKNRMFFCDKCFTEARKLAQADGIKFSIDMPNYEEGPF